jgi:glycosyltransferase involved in cell wall biosynthesis
MQSEITALILTFDEAPNIERTLRRLIWVPRVVLIDSFSTDNTIDLARAAHPHLTLVQRAFDSFAGQCNFGLQHVETGWVLSLDADYELSDELIAEIQGLQPAAEVSGYAVGFRYCVHGRPLRNTLYPPRTVLYRRTKAKYRDIGHGHRVEITGQVVSLIGKINHDDRKPLSRWIREQDRYATIEAAHLLSEPNERLNAQDRLRKRIYFAAPVIFLYLLFVRGLIFDGWPGWYYICQRTFAELLLSLRLLSQRERLE